MVRRLAGLAVFLLPALAVAADAIDVRRGADTMLFGTCVPSLEVVNGSSVIIDYLEVDLVLTLANGEQRTIALQSAYHEGILRPIVPGAHTVLTQPLDLSRSLGVPCDQISSRKTGHILCATHDGKDCSAAVAVEP